MRPESKSRWRKALLFILLAKCRDREAFRKTLTQNVYGSIGLAIFLIVWGLWGIPDFQNRHVPLLNLVYCLGILFAVMVPFFLLGWFSARQKQVLARSKTLEEIAAQMGVEPAMVTEWAEKNRLSPCFVIGDQPLFDETEFDAAQILLRASEPPRDPSGRLLRPASASPSRPDSLLRPID